MKRWIAGVFTAVVFIASPARAQDARVFEEAPAPRLNLEVGTVMGIIFQPYATVGVGRDAWLVRVSGGGYATDCYGTQVNVMGNVRDEGNTKHSVGLIWARYRNGCWYGRNDRRANGQYAGIMYAFQVKGFFIEMGPGFGSRNPFFAEIGDSPLARIYGQIGYVHRFGKKYVDDDEP